MTRTDELLQNFAQKWCLKVIECMKDDDYIMHASEECLADLNVLFDKLMPTEEDFNKAVKVNLPLLIKSTKGKPQYPYISGHAHAEIEKQLGHELYLWFCNFMKGKKDESTKNNGGD